MKKTAYAIVAIVQARMGSTRLPGKVLKDLGGDTILARVVHRLRRARLINEIVIATTTSPADDSIVRECERLAVKCFRGSEQDVLDRYYQAAKVLSAEAVVRITSDCPLIDPELVDATVRTFLEKKADYANNVSPRTFPRGLDVEVLTFAGLERAWREAVKPHEREHVTPYFYEHPELFHLTSIQGESDYSAYRWTLDTSEDLELIRAIYSRLGNRDDFGWHEALAVMEREPELVDLNSHIIQKSLH